MILSRIYDKLNRFEKEDLVGVLALGLVWGLVGGLVWGLALELVGGLVSGLALGLALGLVGGLVSGLGLGLALRLTLGLALGLVGGLVIILVNFTEALPFINGILPILGLIFLIILFTEILFWSSAKEKVKKKDLIKHTLLRKGEALLETLMAFSAITQIYIFTRDINFIEYFPQILKWIGYIGAGLIGLLFLVLIGYGFIKLNSMKYSK